VFKEGKQVCDPPPLADCREKAARQLHGFHEGVRRLLNPHQYTVGIEASLYDLCARLIMEAR
jgi:nicotinate phosphoribosyltransferase